MADEPPGRKAWLATYDWDFVTAQNELLCNAKGAFHGPTSDGHADTKALWETRFEVLMTLDEAVELCRICHRMAPFCFYNGNTFAAIVRDAILKLGLPDAEAFVVRSLAGHIVAGVASEEEVRAFREFCAGLG